jgi:protein involved in polysaccharide export with SLBB domain
MRVVVPRDMDRVQASVRINGQVLTPGLFPIRDGETNLAKLLELAGGFHQDALLKGVYILRENTTPVGNSEQSELDVLLKRTSDQYAQGLKYLDIELGIGQNRVYVDASNAEALQQTLLQDGDQIFVPRDRNSVIVFGQVNKPGVYSFSRDKDLAFYIEQSGGISLAGVKGRIFIIKAGSKNWEKPENTAIESGDMIFVDRKPYEDFVTSQQLEITKTQLTLSIWGLVISAVSTTALLISVLTR